MGWSVLTNSFYLPGSLSGAFVSDWIGPKLTLAIGMAGQGVVGFIMSGAYEKLATPEYVAAFVVVYGCVLSYHEKFMPRANLRPASSCLWVSLVPATTSG